MVTKADPTPKVQTFRVLIANDQEWAARSLESILVPEGYLVHRAYTGSQVLQAVSEQTPDVVILDSQMPDISGPTVCQTLRADPMFDLTIPIIITTAGPAGRSERLYAFEAGAWDFFGQPIDGDTLLTKLRTFLQARGAVKDIRARLMVDDATGLYTATGLARRAEEIASDARRESQPLACVVLRPDRGGAEPGPEGDGRGVFAKQIAEILTRVRRRADALGRLGPLEFGMIAPRTHERGVRSLVARFEGELREATAVNDLSLRAGFYVAYPGVGKDQDAREMLTRAETAARHTSADHPIRAA